MITITDADREAAKLLRDVLADVSGFWHKVDDDSALCLALARHRSKAEKHMLAQSIRAQRRQKRAEDRFGPSPAPMTADRISAL